MRNKPILVNGVDVTKVEGADLSVMSDNWFHDIEMKMIGENDEVTTFELKKFLLSIGYVFPTQELQALVDRHLKSNNDIVT